MIYAGRATAGASWKGCGSLTRSGAGTFNTEASGVDCETALIVTHQWERDCAGAEGPSCDVAEGFNCAVHQTGYEAAVVTCSSARGSVRFDVEA